MSEKARYWSGICYPENMVKDWKESIGDILEIPYCYCIHDRCKDKEGNTRKEHVHIMLVFSNTTTKNHAIEVFNRLSAGSIACCPAIQQVISPRHMYNYLIHDTDDCKKKQKVLYYESERICGNNFDIGAYEQISAAEKDDMIDELCLYIIEKKVTNFSDFYLQVSKLFNREYRVLIKSHSGLFERLIKGVYHKEEDEIKKKKYNDIGSLVVEVERKEKIIEAQKDYIERLENSMC